MYPRALFLLLLALAGCSKPNPLFLGADEGTASAGVTSDATSTGAPTTTTTTTSTSTTDPDNTSVALTGSGGASTTGEPGSSSTGGPLICPDLGAGIAISFKKDGDATELAHVDCDNPPELAKTFFVDKLVADGVQLKDCGDSDPCEMVLGTYTLIIDAPGADTLLGALGSVSDPVKLHVWGAYNLGGFCGPADLAIYQGPNFESVPLVLVHRGFALAHTLAPPQIAKLSVKVSASPGTQDDCVSELVCTPAQGSHTSMFTMFLSDEMKAVELALAVGAQDSDQILDPSDQPVIEVHNVRSHVDEACTQRSEWTLRRL